MLFIDMGGKSKISAQESDLAPFVGNGTKVKIPSEIKLPLTKISGIPFYLFGPCKMPVILRGIFYFS